MPKKVDKTSIGKRFVKMNDAWAEGAPTVEFMGVAQTALSGKKAVIEAKKQTRSDLAAQLKMIDDEIDDLYADLDDTMVNVGNGVRGDKNYGDDSPLYGAMGFKRKSERASGLTRKTKELKK